ncbi:hypothetical protein COW46_01400 [Candidatus Gracilibacteria bacterium CG17_big_fil_post_rev_8_21_14_2_50_48_13]|nr:MAG: hypothetical protein COW46_01400 [Candidatus Gracilibacteria bacterium CG17_big_fil_post_rev_8_21_14_2_50_48_13]
MANIIQIPEEQLATLRSEQTTALGQKYIRVWKSLLYKEGFQRSVLAHRLTLDVPSHGLRLPKINITPLGQISFTEDEIAKIVCMDLGLGLKWVEPIKCFITKNEITLPQVSSKSYIEEGGPKSKKNLELIYEGEEFRAYVYYDLFVSSFIGIHTLPRLVVEYDTDVLAKDAASIFSELKDIREKLDAEHKNERLYTTEMLQYIVNEKNRGVASKQIVLGLKDTFPQLTSNRSLDPIMVNKLYKKAIEKGLMSMN